MNSLISAEQQALIGLEGSGSMLAEMGVDLLQNR